MIIFKLMQKHCGKMNHVLIATMLNHLLTLEMIGESGLGVRPKQAN